MPSIVSGYTYDIFVSYRHKDNQYDGWVTEFVDNLRKDLDATLKEEISIYFDNNKHDGLLETHQVDESLKGKLRCIIFIPILSQTYCDTKSFAWQHEFIAFKKISSEDTFGTKITVTNGNVMSRILPVRIHELDTKDRALIENEIGPIRAIDFIFRSPGVNRPLRAIEDHPNDNQNRTYYRDQINKVANAIKEIIQGIAETSGTVTVSKREDAFGTPFSSRNKIVFAIVLVMVLALAIVGFILFKPTTHAVTAEPIDRSIAVLPFVNMSSDPNQEYFGDGLSEELLNTLSKIQELKVISRTSAFSFKGKNEDSRSIGEKLGVSFLLEGSVRKDSNKIRIIARLIWAKDGTELWSDEYDREINDIFKIQGDISEAVVDQLKISLLGQSLKIARASKPEVYNLFLQSSFYERLGTIPELKRSFYLIRQALAIDSLDSRCWAHLAFLYAQNMTIPFFKQDSSTYYRELGKKASRNAIRLDPDSPYGYLVEGDFRISEWDFKGGEQSYRKALALNPNVAQTNALLGFFLSGIGRTDEALPYLEKAMEYDPFFAHSYYYVARIDLVNEKYDKALKGFDKSIGLLRRPTYFLDKMNCYLMMNRTEDAVETAKLIEHPMWSQIGSILTTWSKGDKPQARKALDEFIKKYYSASFQAAEMYAFFNEKENCFESLERAAARYDLSLTEIGLSPFLKKYAQEPRYKRLLKEINLD